MENVNACPIPNLSLEHYEELEASGLNDDTIKTRGYFTAWDDESLLSAIEEGKATRNQRGKGLVIPLYLAGRKKRKQVTAYQVKLDEPRKVNGHELKYESPSGRPQPIDVGWDKKPLDADVIFTEGIKKTDALRQIFPDAFVIGLSSCNMGMSPKKKPKQMRADLIEELRGREEGQFYLCFDNDMVSNIGVWQGVEQYRTLLNNMDLNVKVVSLPSIGDQKVGVDDLLAQHGEDAVRFCFSLASKDMPEKPARKDGRGQKTADKKQAEDVLRTYKTRYEIDSTSLSDAYAVQTWVGEMSGDLGDRVPSQRHMLLFDSQTGAGYRYDAEHRTYSFLPDIDGYSEVNRWFRQLIDDGLILQVPDRNEFGLEGDQEYVQALQARLRMINAVTSASKARNVYGLLKGDSRVNHSVFNTPNYNHLFPLSGGQCVDFSTPECQLVKTPSDGRFTWCSPVTAEEYQRARQAYLEGERPGRWDAFVDDLKDGRDEFVTALYAVLGYLLHGDRRQLFFIFHGLGRNGKGVILRLLAYLMGEASVDVEGKTFVGRDMRHDQHWLMHRNRRVVIVQDPKGYVEESRVLRYAGGDKIQGEVKGGDTITFFPQGGLVLAGQGDRIQFHLSDVAMRDRLLAVTFTKQFLGEDQDMTLESDLRDEAALILVSLAVSAHKYHASKTIAEYDWLVQCRNEVIRLGNSFFDFWSNQDVYVTVLDMDENDDATVSVPNLIAHYRRYCVENNLKPIDNRNGAVTKSLKALESHVETKQLRRGMRKQMLIGIDFSDHIPQDSPLRDVSGNIDG